MHQFIPGLPLTELFYQEAVRPILDSDFPGLNYSAALIGPGSEVLGYDTPMSSDHHWGPRLLLFLDDGAFADHQARISSTLSAKLPYRFRGYSTNFGAPDKEGTQLLEEIELGPINHRVEIWTVRSFFTEYLGIDPVADITLLDWLTLPEQKLLSVTSGAIFHDGLGTLRPLCEKLCTYPRDVWLYLLAAQWHRISQEEPFMGRCGDVGDELGSRIIAARLVHDLMKLCFLLERRYAPYSKWLGTAFAQLDSAKHLTPVFDKVLSATAWKEREAHLSAAYEVLAQRHNALGITPPLETTVSQFHDRPYLVIHGDRFASAIRAAITDETLKRIAVNIGGVDQFIDCVEITTHARLHKKLTLALYSPEDWDLEKLDV